MRSRFWQLAAVTLFCAWMGRPAWADYSPLITGREWVYQGMGNVEPTLGASAWYSAPVTVKYREELRVKVMTVQRAGNSIVYQVRETDSLYARERYTGGVNVGTLPDTVAVRTLFYTERNGLFTLAHGDSLYFGHRDSLDFLFYSHAAAPVTRTELTGLASPYRGWESIWPLGQLGSGQGWYLDNVGLYWAKLQVSCTMCGCNGSRELKLVSMDGRDIDPGIDPPGSALAKEARISCGLARKGRDNQTVFFATRGGNSANLMGRHLPARRPGR